MDSILTNPRVERLNQTVALWIVGSNTGRFLGQGVIHRKQPVADLVMRSFFAESKDHFSFFVNKHNMIGI